MLRTTPGVHAKDIVYDRYPRMLDTSWAERAYSSGALDPSLGQAFSFPSLLQLRLRIEVPLWRDLTTAKHPNADLSAEEDSDSDATGSAERSPKLRPGGRIARIGGLHGGRAVCER